METMGATINLIKDVILICGVIYGIYEYFLFRKNKSKTEDSLNIQAYPLGQNKFLLDIKIKINNKSQVRKYMKEILLSINTFKDDDVVKSIEEKKMLYFSNKIIKKYRAKDEKNNILDEFPRKIKTLDFWIDGNTSQTFYYPVAVECSDNLIHVNIEYSMEKSGMKYFSEIIETNKLVN